MNRIAEVLGGAVEFVLHGGVSLTACQHHKRRCAQRQHLSLATIFTPSKNRIPPGDLDDLRTPPDLPAVHRRESAPVPAAGTRGQPRQCRLSGSLSPAGGEG